VRFASPHLPAPNVTKIVRPFFRMKQIGIGIAGFGTVGAGVYKHLAQNRDLLSQRLGTEFIVQRIAVRDPQKPRSITAPAPLFTTDWQAVVDDPGVQIVVEVMGGIEEARRLIVRSIEAGKIVVTGNKALLAEHGKEIFDLASARKVPVFFEAAVAGGIPIIKAVREGFVGNHIKSIHGIINGTTNYILTRMTEAGLDYAEALAEAQAQGFAEADPTLDVNGWDAAHKAIILASLAYGTWISPAKVFVEGIEHVTARDIGFAKNLGYRIKLLGIIKADAAGEIEVRVHPTLVPEKHVLASVNGVFNALCVHGDIVGETLFYGRGAGQDATASAVIADIAEAATALDTKRRDCGFMPHGLYGDCKPLDAISCPYYLRVPVDDKPGVLAQVAGILGSLNVGISSMIQPESAGNEAELILMLHDATHAQVGGAIAKLESLACVKGKPRLLRVENFA
jgi:homoserine dehydrogenase